MLNDQRVNKFIKEDAKQMEGWFFPSDMVSFYLLDMIQRAMGISGSICEVGVYHGKSLVRFSLMRREGERLTGYDLFDGELLSKTQQNLQTFGNPEATELIKGNTSEFTEQMLAEKLSDGLRLLHIDAGHEYHEVFQQMLLFAPFVTPGGVIIMDDYQDREFPGIEAAVLDFADIDRPRRFVPFFAGGNKMYLCEAHRAVAYQEALLGTDILKKQSRVTRVRDFTVLVGFSKLPVDADKCLQNIMMTGFLAVYEFDHEGLRTKSGRFQQKKFGSGR